MNPKPIFFPAFTAKNAFILSSPSVLSPHSSYVTLVIGDSVLVKWNSPGCFIKKSNGSAKIKSFITGRAMNKRDIRGEPILPSMLYLPVIPSVRFAFWN